MKKLNISEKQVSTIFIAALIFLIGTSLISIIGHRLGILAVNDSFDNFKNNTIMYAILPAVLFLKLLQWIGVVPHNRSIGEIYTKDAYPRVYQVMRYGKMAFGIVVLALVSMLIIEKLIQN